MNIYDCVTYRLSSRLARNRGCVRVLQDEVEVSHHQGMLDGEELCNIVHLVGYR